jgi:hypothetical protein
LELARYGSSERYGLRRLGVKLVLIKAGAHTWAPSLFYILVFYLPLLGFQKKNIKFASSPGGRCSLLQE